MIIIIYINYLFIYNIEIKEINNIKKVLKKKFYIFNLELIIFYQKITMI